MPLIGPFLSEEEALRECMDSDSGGSDGDGSDDDTDRIWCGCGDMPDTLTMTVSGDCSFANGSYAMAWREGIGGYAFSNPTANPGVVSAGTGTGGCGYHVQVRCPGAGFVTFYGFLSVSSCRPFTATGTGPAGGKGGCCESGTVSVTISG